MAIVVFHFGRDIAPFNAEMLSFIFANANIGVSYFFTLSGFIMILAYGKYPEIKASEYYRSRMARIAPAYYAALILFIPVIVAKATEFDYLGLLLNATLLQAWVPSKALSVNSPGWSLSVELFFYALFPVLFNHLYRGKKLWLVTVLGVGFFCLSQAVHIALIHSDFLQASPSARHDFIYYFPLMHLNEFIMGNVAGLFYIRYLSHRQYDNGLWIALATMALLYLLSLSPILPLHNGLLVVVFIPLILLIVSDAGVFSKLMSLKPLVYLGEISFGVYIFQAPVYMLSTAVFKRVGLIDPGLVFFLYLAALLLVSALSFNYIEVPLRRRINKRQSTRTSMKVAV
jgi:peptidoglycan/LPS O-acetylase OafA/YrhL